MVLGGGSDCSTTVHTCFTAAAAGESLLLESAFRSRAREFGRGSCCFGRRGSALGWAGWLRLPLIAINHSCCCYLRSALCLGFAVRFRRERETWFSVARVRAWVFDCDGCWGDGGDDDGYGEGLCEYGVRGWAEVVWIRGDEGRLRDLGASGVVTIALCRVAGLHIRGSTLERLRRTVLMRCPFER